MSAATRNASGNWPARSPQRTTGTSETGTRRVPAIKSDNRLPCSTPAAKGPPSSRMLASHVAAADRRRHSGNGTPCSANTASSRANSATPDQCQSTPTKGKVETTRHQRAAPPSRRKRIAATTTSAIKPTAQMTPVFWNQMKNCVRAGRSNSMSLKISTNERIKPIETPTPISTATASNSNG